jgi:hypothetical protein
MYCILIKKEYPNLGLKALQVLIQFSTLYLSELRFFALVNNKSKKEGETEDI